MSEFATQHQMELTPRYRDEPSWEFTWVAGPVTRKIQLNIFEMPNFLDLKIHTMAWRDEPGPKRTVEGHPRSYTVRLPVSEQIFLETLDWVRRDAASLEVRSP